VWGRHSKAKQWSEKESAKKGPRKKKGSFLDPVGPGQCARHDGGRHVACEDRPTCPKFTKRSPTGINKREQERAAKRAAKAAALDALEVEKADRLAAAAVAPPAGPPDDPPTPEWVPILDDDGTPRLRIAYADGIGRYVVQVPCAWLPLGAQVRFVKVNGGYRELNTFTLPSTMPAFPGDGTPAFGFRLHVHPQVADRRILVGRMEVRALQA